MEVSQENKKKKKKRKKHINKQRNKSEVLCRVTILIPIHSSDGKKKLCLCTVKTFFSILSLVTWKKFVVKVRLTKIFLCVYFNYINFNRCRYKGNL